MGGEYSKLAQTGSQGLTRSFVRPKGSASLAWTPEKGLDISLKFARVVGQLSFSDFLARVDLDQGNGSAGNVELVPPQSWELDLEAKKDLGKWGSTTLKLYANWYEDYIDWIAFPGQNPGELVEARGNIDTAKIYGIDWTSTINLDPIGWKGAKIDFRANLEDPTLVDPLTGDKRAFSGWNDTYINGDLRHDIPKSNWALGARFREVPRQPILPALRGRAQLRGPDLHVRLHREQGRAWADRAAQRVQSHQRAPHRPSHGVRGPRSDSPVSFHEDTDEGVGLIYNLTIRGDVLALFVAWRWWQAARMREHRALAALLVLSSPAAADPGDDAAAMLARIAAIDDAGPKLDAVIVANPDAPAEARAAADLPLAGRTVLVKDNIETREWPTTAGSLALAGNMTGRDAPLIVRLRAAGGGGARQDQSLRVGQHPLLAQLERVERGWRADQQSFRRRAQSVRLVLGQRRGSGGGPGLGGDRHRDRRLDHLPGERQRHRRLQADRRPRQPDLRRADQP